MQVPQSKRKNNRTASPAPRRTVIEALEDRTLMTLTPFFPSQIETAYGFNNITFDNGTVQGNGATQTIAIIGAYNDATIRTDLTAFDSALGIGNTSFTVVGQNGGAVPSDPGGVDGSAETALDVEWAHALAPKADILLVEANSTASGDLQAAAAYAASVKGVSVVSISYDGPESPFAQSDDSSYASPTNHNGVTFVAAAGDNSSVTYPSTSPFVVGVGGTTLNLANSTGTYGSETAWTSTGGGASTVEPEPDFQLNAQSTGFRTAPDVAFYADPNQGGLAIVSNGLFIGAAGTSAGAPCWAALFAIADQGRALNGLDTLNGSSQTLPMLYALLGTPLFSSAFHVVTGNDTTTGYSELTGLGSPNASVLVQYLAGNISVPEPATSTIAIAVMATMLFARPARKSRPTSLFSNETLSG